MRRWWLMLRGDEQVQVVVAGVGLLGLLIFFVVTR